LSEEGGISRRSLAQSIGAPLGHDAYRLRNGNWKTVEYFVVHCPGPEGAVLGPLPHGTSGRQWISLEEIDTVTFANVPQKQMVRRALRTEIPETPAIGSTGEPSPAFQLGVRAAEASWWDPDDWTAFERQSDIGPPMAPQPSSGWTEYGFAGSGSWIEYDRYEWRSGGAPPIGRSDNGPDVAAVRAGDPTIRGGVAGEGTVPSAQVLPEREDESEGTPARGNLAYEVDLSPTSPPPEPSPDGDVHSIETDSELPSLVDSTGSEPVKLIDPVVPTSSSESDDGEAQARDAFMAAARAAAAARGNAPGRGGGASQAPAPYDPMADMRRLAERQAEDRERLRLGRVSDVALGELEERQRRERQVQALSILRRRPGWEDVEVSRWQDLRRLMMRCLDEEETRGANQAQANERPSPASARAEVAPGGKGQCKGQGCNRDHNPDRAREGMAARYQARGSGSQSAACANKMPGKSERKQGNSSAAASSGGDVAVDANYAASLWLRPATKEEQQQAQPAEAEARPAEQGRGARKKPGRNPPKVNAIGPGTVAAGALALIGPAAWKGTVQVIDTAVVAGAVVIDSVGAEATRTVQETASVLRACLRVGVISMSAIAAVGGASRLLRGYGWMRLKAPRPACLCKSRSLVAAVAAVRHGNRSRISAADQKLADVPPLKSNGFEVPSLKALEEATRSWHQSFVVAKEYDVLKCEASGHRVTAKVARPVGQEAPYCVVASAEAPLASSCTCGDFVRRGPLCKHATAVYLRMLAGGLSAEARTPPPAVKAKAKVKRPDTRGEMFSKAARDLNKALDESVAEDARPRRPRSSPPRPARMEGEHPSWVERDDRAPVRELFKSKSAAVEERDLWRVKDFYDAAGGLACWVKQLGEARYGDRVDCLFYTFDHPELVEALGSATGRGARVRVVVDEGYVRSGKCFGMRGAIKQLGVSGIPVRGACGLTEMGGRVLQWPGIQHCKAICSESEGGCRMTLSAGSLNGTQASQKNEEFVASGPLTAEGRQAWNIRYDSIFSRGESCDSGVPVTEIAGYARGC